jgi:cyclophilin family peptidyl-prolyl cis-trans isomerase
MANRTSQHQRERRAARDQAARRAAERASRRRQAIAIAAVVVVLLAVVGTVVAAVNGADKQAAAPTTTSTTLPGDSSSTIATGPTVSLPPSTSGATLTGATPCPAEDGSSPRTTLFAGPPPQCLDPAVAYNAVIDTSVGPLTLSLYTDLAPQAVNNLAVLARYHYWDGLPITSIIPRATMQVATDLTTDGKASPGYTLAGEYQKGGIVITPGMLAFAPVSSDNRIGGALLMALGEKAADLPPTTTIVGLLLDGTDALAAINKAGTQSGAPTKVITITSVRVIRAPVSTTTTR